jgi:hypothetical protein
LSWGVLVDIDAVLVPGPLDWLHDPEITFEVLVASARREGPGIVERIRVASAQTLGLTERPDGAVAMLRLAHESAHRPYAESFDEAAIEAALTGDPDVWAALEGTGVLPRDVRTLPVDDVLGPVATWERQIREGLTRDRSADDPSHAVGLLCCWIFRCNRCGTCPDQWW